MPNKPDNWSELTSSQRRAWRLNNFLKSGESITFVSEKARQDYETRARRLYDAYNIQESDRVPLSISAGNLPLLMAGLNVGQDFYEPEKTMDAYRKFNEKYADMLESFSMSYAFSGEVMDMLDYRLYAWPGHGLPMEAAGWQFIEGEYMTVDEYDDLLRDPSDFWIRKYLPRVFGVFGPMRMFQQFTNITENVHVGQLMVLAADPVQDMLRRLLETGEVIKRVGALMSRRGNYSGASHGFPSTFGGFAKAPFDTLGDTLRGTTNIMKDMYRRPETLLKALDVIADITIENVLTFPNVNDIFLVIFPLHKGADGWMSQKQFEKFYWPSLKKVLDALVNEGLIPTLFAEGGYNSRIHYVNQFEKGAISWMFDRTDMAEAKKALGNNCCIIGNVPSSMVVTSTPEKVKECCRELIENCAPGGGYILSPGSTSEKPKLENLLAMVEAVNEYGYYRK